MLGTGAENTYFLRRTGGSAQLQLASSIQSPSHSRPLQSDFRLGQCHSLTKLRQVANPDVPSQNTFNAAALGPGIVMCAPLHLWVDNPLLFNAGSKGNLLLGIRATNRILDALVPAFVIENVH